MLCYLQDGTCEVVTQVVGDFVPNLSKTASIKRCESRSSRVDQEVTRIEIISLDSAGLRADRVRVKARLYIREVDSKK